LLTVCGKCTARLQLETHSMGLLFPSGRFGPKVKGVDSILQPDQFEQVLRREMPDELRLKKAAAGIDPRHLPARFPLCVICCAGIGTEPFRLTRVERERGYIQLRYVAHGASGPVAFLSVCLGRLEASGTGIKAVLFDLSKGTRGALRPAARLLLRSPGSADVWEASASRNVMLQMKPVGKERTPSFRAEMGSADTTRTSFLAYPSRSCAPSLRLRQVTKTSCPRLRCGR